MLVSKHTPMRAHGGVRAQDYVKWRGQLFHQFLRALVDDSHQVRSLAHHLLAEALATKVGLPIRAQQHTSHDSPKGAKHGSSNPSKYNSDILNPALLWLVGHAQEALSCQLACRRLCWHTITSWRLSSC